MSLLASANFNGRLVPREVGAADYEFPAPASQEPDRATVGAHAVSAVPFTEPCGDAPLQVKTAPVDATPGAGAVILSEASRFILSLIAAYRGRGESEALAWALAEGGKAIGVPALLARGADDIEDLADLPGYARKAANRFRSGGP
jgi:hypothetical protein